jgi:signal peptidase I
VSVGSIVPESGAAAPPLPDPTPHSRSPRSSARETAARLLSLVLWLAIVPGLAAWVTLRYLVPARSQAAAGGLAGFLARQVDEHPLLVTLGLFVVLAEIARYWRRRLARPATGGGAVPARAALRFAVTLAVVVSAALLLRGFVVELYFVSGPSMLPTLSPGDRLVVNKLAYGLKLPFSQRRVGAKTPKRGDVIVFRTRELGRPGATRPLVKRVVALPGDRVAFQDGRPVVNGWTVPLCDCGPFAGANGKQTIRGRLGVEFLEDEVYLAVWTPAEAGFPEYLVRPGEVFVTGDDRGLSGDSRIWQLDGGAAGVPIDLIEGRVSRVAVGERSDGRLDYARVLAPLGTKVRQPGVDIGETDKRIAACLARRPRPATSPPAQTSDATTAGVGAPSPGLK